MTDVNWGSYACLRLTAQSADRLHAWSREAGFNNPMDPQDYHITICYSTRPLHYVPLNVIPPMPVRPKGLDLFGKNKDYLVMRVESMLARNRNEYANVLGAASDFPDYKPHISLAKESGVTDVDDLPPFVHNLYVNREEYHILDPNFKPEARRVDPMALKMLFASDETVMDRLRAAGYRKVKSSFGTHDTLVHKGVPFGDKKHIAMLTALLKTNAYQYLPGVLPGWKSRHNRFLSMHNRKGGGHYLFMHSA